MDVDTASTLIGSKRAAPFLPDDLELAGSAVQPIRIAYGYPKQPLQAFADLPGGQHVSAQYTSGVFPWSSSFQHGGLVDGKVWAAGIQWPEPTPTKDSAMQKIHAALADAGVPADAFDSSQTYVSTKYGVANSKLAGDSFSLTFTDPAAAMELLLGKISVSLPIRGATSADAGLSGSPVWTKHPGTLQLAKGDYAAAKVLVLSKSIEGLDAAQLSLLLIETANKLYKDSLQLPGSQQQQILQLKQLADSLQHYPGHVKKQQQYQQGVVMFGSPVSARIVMGVGSVTTSLGEVRFAPPYPPLKVRGIQVVLGPHYVGNLLAIFRGVPPYKLGGQRIPTEAELRRIKQLVGEILGAGEEGVCGPMPDDPPPQALRSKPNSGGQVAAVLLAVPSQAAADKLIIGIQTTDGLFLKWENRKMKPK